jgi:hypothetical protein
MHLSKPHVHITKTGVKLPADTAHVYLQLSTAYIIALSKLLHAQCIIVFCKLAVVLHIK